MHHSIKQSSEVKGAVQIQAAVDRALAQQRLVGAVVIAAHRGEIFHCQAAGYADRESQRPMTVDGVFRLASVSKPIVSVAALVLVAQGKLRLDDEVAHWLPAFRPRLADQRDVPITIRQLLSHTAGLGYRFLEADEQGPLARAGVSDGMDDSALTLAENLSRIASAPLLYPPGDGWGYSLASDVLGAVVEKVVQQPLNSAIRALVTAPLGMLATGFSASRDSNVVTAYVSDTPRPRPLREGEIVTPFDGAVGIRYSPERVFDACAWPSGGAGMVGTAGDLLRLLEALRRNDEQLLPRPLIAEMVRDHAAGFELPAAPGFGFGLGFSLLRDSQLADSPESPGTWRWGGEYGHSWFVDPQRELSVVAFTNTLYEGMSGQFVTELRDAVYADLEARG
ncbi:serine hydrolase domain-containing protein [Erwinia sp. V71]|uniref:serine hydrolase domain-containing protein n=1 Tax=Erwinia sp. V71 TaxID=3369424 RepID=UPI003F5DC6FC